MHKRYIPILILSLLLIAAGIFVSVAKKEITPITNPSPVVAPSAPVPQTPITPDPVPKADINNLSGSTFRLESYNGASVPTDNLLTFMDGRISAKFCNSMGGEYDLRDGVLTANLVSTQMYCQSPDDLMNIESAFGKMLYTGASFKLSGNKLTLSDKEATLVFELYMD